MCKIRNSRKNIYKIVFSCLLKIKKDGGVIQQNPINLLI